MSNLNKKTLNVKSAGFELEAFKKWKNIPDDVPKYICWLCENHPVPINGDMCQACVDEQAIIEKELLEGELL